MDAENNELNFYDFYNEIEIMLPKKWERVDLSIICPTNTTVKYKFTVVTDKELDSSELPQYVDGITQKDVDEIILELVRYVLKYVYGNWSKCDISMTWSGGFNMKLLYS